MKTSQAGIDLIKSFEGYGSQSYDDGGGVWTIGYGHTNNVLPLQKTTPQEAERFLRDDLAEAERAMNKLVKVSISQAQFDALVSLMFNIGADAFASSTLLKRLNTKDYYGAREQFKRWNKDNGKVLNGLSRRRSAEAEMFMLSIDKPLIQSKRVVGGAMAVAGGSTGAVVQVLMETLPQVQGAITPLSEYLEWAKYACLALTIAGGMIAVYSKVIELRNGGIK
jgi:lysozyme